VRQDLGNKDVNRAQELLWEFKGDTYAFGEEVLDRVGRYAASLGKVIVVISGKHAKTSGILDTVIQSIDGEGVTVNDVIDGARPNAPREDVYRLAYQLSNLKWDGIVVVGGGSCIDASKAALVLAMYRGLIDGYFGTGRVSDASRGEKLPLVAVQTASSSAAHLTKYSNITDVVTNQKKLIVDESIVPKAAIFDYSVTKTMSQSFTKDGGLDGIAHCWEVWMGSSGKPYYNKISEIAYLGIKLIVENLPTAVKVGADLKARYALGLGTDLGGYSIMVGGTNAGHLGSFSLIDVLSHGRACAILNPYYTVLFSSVIQNQLKKVAGVYHQAGFIEKDVLSLKGRKLAEVVAEGMISLSRKISFPTTLKEAGTSREHLTKMLHAAKDPQLKMKLQNMPLPMNVVTGDIDRLMEPTLEAAYSGDLPLIPNLSE
jgi:alcohol dehydrogenase